MANDAIRIIVNKLIEKGQLDDAKKAALLLLDSCKNEALLNISEKYLLQCKYDKAVDAISLTRIVDEKKDICGPVRFSIAEKLMDLGQVDKASIVAYSITKEMKKELKIKDVNQINRIARAGNRYQNKYEEPPLRSGLIHMLPSDVFKSILFNLDVPTLYLANSVNPTWNFVITYT